MNLLNKKLSVIKEKIDQDNIICIMIIGLGSVGCYLLDYLISQMDEKIKIIVVGRKIDKIEMSINITKVSALIRKQLKSKIIIDKCDLNNVNEITRVINKYKPEFILNSSRAYSGLKYGTISWHTIRAYGLWAPLAMKYIRNIMKGVEHTSL